MRPRTTWLAVAALALGAVGVALVSQHRFDMQPCPWCVLQRLLFVLIALFAFAAALLPARVMQLGAAAGSVALAVAGVASALWQHFVAASSSSCKLTLAERILDTLRLDAALPEIFQPRASCADAAVALLGVPYEFYSLLLFIALAVMAMRATRAH